MKSQSAMDTVQYVAQSVPVSVGTAVFLGIQVTDWVVILSIIIGVMNISWFCVRFYDRFFGNGKPSR